MKNFNELKKLTIDELETLPEQPAPEPTHYGADWVAKQAALTDSERQALTNVGLVDINLSTKEGYNAVMSTILIGNTIGMDSNTIAALRRVIATTKALRHQTALQNRGLLHD